MAIGASNAFCVSLSQLGFEDPYVQDASTAAISLEADYIIVGGGTAGCPLAATLSERFSVILLERGGVPYDQVNQLIFQFLFL